MLSYELKDLPDGRFSVQKDGKEYGIYNSKKVAEKEKRRLNGEPLDELPQETRCHRFDAKEGLATIPCRMCERQIQDGGFFYFINGRIVCADCQEGSK